ncbi:hypothetical protein [Vibrio sp. MA40-2]|uniref:hypothetical protein n=1 Tax=Vibrio sp. MA40-2 TaxID=3391828 RepID=UPI0039A5891F
MLSVIKNLFISQKDYAGRDVDAVIMRLAARTGTDTFAWSYLTELAVYENTVNGMRVYPHELAKHAA